MVDNSVVRWRAFESKSIKCCFVFFSKSLLRFSLKRNFAHPLKRVIFFFFLLSFPVKSSGSNRNHEVDNPWKKKTHPEKKNMLTMNELMYRQVFSSVVVFLMSSAFMIGWNWRAETTRRISIARRQMLCSTAQQQRTFECFCLCSSSSLYIYHRRQSKDWLQKRIAALEVIERKSSISSLIVIRPLSLTPVTHLYISHWPIQQTYV